MTACKSALYTVQPGLYTLAVRDHQGVSMGHQQPTDPELVEITQLYMDCLEAYRQQKMEKAVALSIGFPPKIQQATQKLDKENLTKPEAAVWKLTALRVTLLCGVIHHRADALLTAIDTYQSLARIGVASSKKEQQLFGMARFNKGVAMLELGKVAEAAKDFQSAASLLPLEREQRKARQFLRRILSADSDEQQLVLEARQALFDSDIQE